MKNPSVGRDVLRLKIKIFIYLVKCRPNVA